MTDKLPSFANESLKAADAECGEGRTAPRVTLADIEAYITGRFFILGNDILQVCGAEYTEEQDDLTSILTVCLVTTVSGFTVLGKSAPMSADNFNAELGRKLAYEDCIRQMWPLMAFAAKHLHMHMSLPVDPVMPELREQDDVIEGGAGNTRTGE